MNPDQKKFYGHGLNDPDVPASSGMTVQDELKLKERVNRAEGELRVIDSLIARRPALSEPTRYDNIAKAIRVASERDELARQLDLLKGNYDRKVDECRAEYQRAETWHRVADERSAEIVRLQRQWVPFKQPQTESERYDESQREAHKEMDKVSELVTVTAIVCCGHGQFTVLNPCPQCNPLVR